jgi:hypothetical protein
MHCEMHDKPDDRSKQCKGKPGRTQSLELQNDGRQVGALELRDSLQSQRLERSLRAQPVGFSGTDSASASRSLRRRCLRDRHHREEVDTCLCVITLGLCEAAVDDVHNSRDGYACFGNICGDYNFSGSFWCRGESLQLCFEGQGSVEGCRGEVDALVSSASLMKG